MEEEVKLSVILAVYNKQNSIIPVFNLLVSTIEEQIGIKEYELIFVDDASKDNSQEILKQLSSNPKAVIVSHAKNLGQLKTLETGLKKAKGNVIVISSCDLQNPLDQSAALYRAVESGYDSAIAYRSSRAERGITSFVSAIFLRMVSSLFPKFPKGGFDFAAINSAVRKKLLEKDFDKIFLQLEILKIAERVYQIPVVRNADHLDHSGWTTTRRVSYAFKALRFIIFDRK
jgi:glycosyltransferase involved in cell wall biosynthesis